jgi:hypothetical protein
MRKLVLLAALALTIAGASLGGAVVWGNGPVADDAVIWGV